MLAFRRERFTARHRVGSSQSGKRSGKSRISHNLAPTHVVGGGGGGGGRGGGDRRWRRGRREIVFPPCLFGVARKKEIETPPRKYFPCFPEVVLPYGGFRKPDRNMYCARGLLEERGSYDWTKVRHKAEQVRRKQCTKKRMKK